MLIGTGINIGSGIIFSPTNGVITASPAINFTTPATMNGSTTLAYMYAATVNSSGRFVAVGWDSSAYPLYATSTDGTTWTTPAKMNGSTTPAKMYSVAVNSSGLFVAVGFFYGTTYPVYATSTDGSTWTTPAAMNGSTTFAVITSVTVNSSGRFVAVGYNTNSYPVYATSANGSTWTTPALMNGSTTVAYMSSVTVNSSGRFVAIGSDSNNYPVYATSTDGSTWTTPALMNGSTAGVQWGSVGGSIAVNSSGRFVAVGYKFGLGHPVYATSTDGSTWTTPALMNGSTTIAYMQSVTVSSAGLFVAVGYDSIFDPVYAISADGTTWTTPARMNGSTTPAYMYGVAVSSFGQFAAVGYTQSNSYPAYAVASPTYSVTPAFNNINEGSGLTINVSGTNIIDGTYYWTVTNSGDFGTSSGSFSITGNSGSFTVTPTADSTTEGSETFTVSLRTGSTSGTVVATSSSITINDTSTTPAPSYSVAAAGAATSVNEGSSLTFNVTGSNITDGTYYWAINNTTTSSGDFGTNSGSFTITSNSGSFTVTPTADSTTEGSETFTVSVLTGSVSGTVVATSSSITVNDTSTTPSTTYSATPAANNINEGSSLTINVSGTNITNGTYYWTISNNTTSNADFSAVSGSFTITSNAGSFTVTPTADSTTEGSEYFAVQIRTGSTSGTVVATTTTITVNDTSVGSATYSATPAAGSVNEGNGLTINVSGTGITDGTYYWTINNWTTTNSDFATTNGSFTITSNAGNFTVTPAADLTTEGSETFSVAIRSGSIGGPLLATTSNITINDTSTSGGGGGGGGGPAVTVLSSFPSGVSASSGQTHGGISQSIYFNGTQTLPLVAATNSAFATYPVTIEAWIYDTVDGGAMMQAVNTSTFQATTYFNQGLYQLARGKNYGAAQSWSHWTYGSWRHLAMTLWSSTGSTTVADKITWWNNGVSDGYANGGSMTLTVSGGDDYTITGENILQLGIWQFGAGSYGSPFTGYISEVRVSSTARYGTSSATFTPANFTSDANTIALFRAV